MIPTARLEDVRSPRIVPDFFRRSLRLAGILGILALILSADAAAAAEETTRYVRCGTSETVVAELVPAFEHTLSVNDVTRTPAITLVVFSFPGTIDHVAAHLDEIRSVLRERMPAAGCQSSLRITAGYRGLSLPRPPNVSNEADSSQARFQPAWKHADIRYFQERGQGDLITASDARYTDPEWPVLAVGAFVFFSAGNGGDRDAAVVYTWSNVGQQYNRVAEVEGISLSNRSGVNPRSYVGNNLPIPASIPVSGADPALDLLLMNKEAFYKAIDSQVGGCDAPTGARDEIARCANEGNAVLLASAQARTWDTQYTNVHVVGAVRLSGNFFGEVLIYSPEQQKYLPSASLPGQQAVLCRTCFLRDDMADSLRVAMRANILSPPAVDTSATVTATVGAMSDTASALPPIATPEAAPGKSWRAPQWLRRTLPYTVGIIAIALAVALLLFLREQARLAQLRRTLQAMRERSSELDDMVDEALRELHDARGDYERLRALHRETVEETEREIRS